MVSEPAITVDSEEDSDEQAGLDNTEAILVSDDEMQSDNENELILSHFNPVTSH
jgi:hypothetical protein